MIQLEDLFVSVAQRTLVAGTPLLLGTIGEVICERSGILNLGVEGMMAIGAVTAFIVTFVSGNPWLGLMAAIAAGMLISSVHAFASVSLQANQVVSGLALTMLGLGISGLVGKPYIGRPLTIKFQTTAVPVLSDFPFIGPIFFNQSPFFYMAILLAAALRDIPISEYSPREIKSAVVGTGNASKDQVGYMVQRQLRLKAPPTPTDAADGVAAALCHFLVAGHHTL